MGPFRYHVFVCKQQKAEGVPCCAARGSAKVLEALRKEAAQRASGMTCWSPPAARSASAIAGRT